jgi:hypothetical protein
MNAPGILKGVIGCPGCQPNGFGFGRSSAASEVVGNEWRTVS